MFKIAEKYPLNTSKTIYRVSIEAPLVAKAAKPGQFAIFRLDEFGERFPLTIADYDPEAGTVTSGMSSSLITESISSNFARSSSEKRSLMRAMTSWM